MNKNKHPFSSQKDILLERIENSFQNNIKNQNNCTTSEIIPILYSCFSKIKETISFAILHMPSKAENNILKELNSLENEINQFEMHFFKTVNELSDFCYGDGSYIDSKSFAISNEIINTCNSFLVTLSKIVSRAYSVEQYNPIKNSVFIVHGHNLELRDWLYKKLKYNKKIIPIILEKQKSEPIYVFEKFIKYANQSEKAIILATANDDGNDKKYILRENVLIEFGYFLSLLKRNNIIYVLEKGIKPPSDIDGVCYIEYNGDKKLLLKKILNNFN